MSLQFRARLILHRVSFNTGVKNQSGLFEVYYMQPERRVILNKQFACRNIADAIAPSDDEEMGWEGRAADIMAKARNF